MSFQSVIPQSDDRLFTYFLKESLLGLFDSAPVNSSDPTQKKRDDRLPFILLGLILIVATEPFKVVLRKNIGKRSFSLPRLSIAAILYLIWGGVLYHMQTQSAYEEYKIEFYAGVFFYGLLAFMVLILGVTEYFKGIAMYNENQEPNRANIYRGDSLFFGGQDKRKIWLITEPLFCFVLGLIVTFLPMLINPILGLIGAPILITSLSFWFNEAY